MAVTTISSSEGTGYINITSPISVTASESTFSVSVPTSYAMGNVNNYSTTASRYYRVNYLLNDGSTTWKSNQVTSGTVANSSTYASLAGFAFSSMNTSQFFNSSNASARTKAFQLKTDGLVVGYDNGDYLISPSSYPTVSTVNVTLNAPPTFTVSSLSIDTAYIYTGLTTASVSVSSLSAKYGGSISEVKFTIGSQSVTRTNAGTLSILLENVGTFTPTVTVTDSRGQTTTKTLDAITVNGYVAPSVSFTGDRTLSTGVPDDEGTYITVDATFLYTDVVATLVEPSVTMTDSNGTATTPVVTWYSTRASDGTLSGSVTWSSVARGQTVYGLIPNANTQYSYQVAIRPRDSEGTGTAISQTIPSAFYTVDFLAGGHGIAFGKPASETGFECAMTATFEDEVYIDISDYATSGTTDKDIYDAIVALGWDSDVLVN